MYHRPFLNQVLSPARQLTFNDRQSANVDRGFELTIASVQPGHRPAKFSHPPAHLRLTVESGIPKPHSGAGARDNEDVRRSMPLRRMIQVGPAANRSEILRFVPSGSVLLSAFLATNVPQIPQRSFPKTAETPALT
jgi:hypothetical protein